MRSSYYIFLVGCLTLLTSCRSNEYKLSEYTSMRVNASPGVETQVQMEDGSGISIPEESIIEDVSLLIERNPEKTKSLPEIPEGFVQASDFYNYQITQGSFVGPVDLIMPFDESLKPDPEAELVAGFPVEGGWTFVAVTDMGNGRAVLYTNNFGDPVIGWRFNPTGKKSKTEEEAARRRLDWAYCESGISIYAEPVTNDAGNWLKINVQYFDPNNDYAGVPFKISINQYIPGIHDNVIEGVTSNLGTYEKWFVYEELSALTDQAESYARARNRDSWGNSLVVRADCRTVAGNPNLMPGGYLWDGLTWYYTLPELDVLPATEVAEIPAGQAASTPNPIPAATEEPIPPGAIQLPDFVGTPFDEAVAWLKQNGFKHMWVDGKSTFDVGVIYAQQPAAGKYKVPHRTTVMLYRTIETVIDPCFGLDLTLEECGNLGKHSYHFVTTDIYHRWSENSCRGPLDKYQDLDISFSGDDVTILGIWWKGEKTFTKVAINNYIAEDDPDWVYILVFTNTGFIITEKDNNPNPVCVWTHTFTFSP